jgi:UDP-N-acetylmuramate--alanine ligase
MLAAAELLLRCGVQVSGSDLNEFPGMGDLVASGALVHLGHRAAQLPDQADLLVISAAIPRSNPELIEARHRGVEVITYAELLGRLMARREGVSIAGTHGKSTTTAMTAHIYRVGGLDPSFIIGAHSDQLGGSSGAGTGRHFIAESCEYARSFLHQRPALATILNIEREHLDCYADLADIVSAFSSFAGNVRPNGVLIVSHADPVVAQATQTTAAPVETFGLDGGACWMATDLRADRGRYSFAVHYGGRFLFQTALQVAGRHNLTNSLAAAALAWHGGVEPEAIAEGVRTYRPIARRMSLRATGRGVTVVDDYAHHPTEIRVTLQAIRSRVQPQRTWVVFQPHQHSRTRLLMDEFAGCFADADMVLVSDIYAVRDSEEERRLTGADELVARIHAGGGAARYLPTLEEVAEHLTQQVTAGDLVVTMGAGDVWKVADELAERVGRAG